MLTRCSLGFLLIYSCLTLLSCAISSDEATIDQYNQFAIRSAESELWNESIFRWKQILEIQPQNARAHNNLGVAYEASGKTDQAIESYKRATELEPDNKFFRFNYRKCRLHVRRNSKNQPDVEEEEVDFSG